MWIATTVGFFSAVQHRDTPADVLVRARSHRDLVNLVDFARALDVEDPLEIVETLAMADYPYRVQMPATLFGSLFAALTEAIDYDNFKNGVAKVNRQREATYHRVWAVLRDIEREPGAIVKDVATQAKLAGAKAAKAKARK